MLQQSIFSPRRASKERGDLRQGTMESLTSSFHRRGKKVKAASTACLQIFPVSFGDKDAPQSSVHSGGEMLCFGVVITKKSESELSYAGFLILK